MQGTHRQSFKQFYSGKIGIFRFDLLFWSKIMIFQDFTIKRHSDHVSTAQEWCVHEMALELRFYTSKEHTARV